MQQPDPVQVQHMMLAMMPIFVLMGLIGSAVMVVPFWVIFKKAGMSGAMSLLMLFPVVNLVMLYVLAFSQWRVVPVPEYGMPYPPPGFPPAYPPPGYAPPVAYPTQTAQAPGYVPPSDPPSTT
ncbi:hypothetical protein [Terriglobus roseus]|uniref:Uncharacterized protein n=1 Tax=Terriglobus roseus TaxID=392734 RepID=A0A1H4L408_9BACT|nr:hypothetical protein [Terriglobus roseus]SEB65216.1 hypothetical protein SAMN05443244_1455 [Terriglobus roseus]